jgi:excisionase family DNA binding protein
LRLAYQNQGTQIMKNLILAGVSLDDFLLHIEKVIDNKLGAQSSTKKTDDAEYIIRKEVAKLLKVCLPTLHDWTKLGWLQSYKMGNRVLYKKHEVEAALHQVQFQKGKKGGAQW